MRLAPRHGIDLHGADDVGEWDQEERGIFLFVLVEGEVFGAEDGPEAFPLPDPTARF